MVVSEYQASGFDLVRKACNNNEEGVPNYLEVRKQASNADESSLEKRKEAEEVSVCIFVLC